MKERIVVISGLLLLGSMTAALSATPVASPPLPPVCYSILTVPCADCPGYTSSFCNPNARGIFKTCESYLYPECGIGDNVICTRVNASTGPPCPLFQQPR